MRIKIIIIQLLFLCFVYNGHAQNLQLLPTDNPLKTHVDSIVHKQVLENINESMIIGMSFGLYINNNSHFYNYGTIEKGKQQLPNQNTIYEIGSITKTITSIILANAVLENKINLNDDIRKYLKGNYENLQYNSKPIKVENLANHTSGLPEDIFPEKLYSLQNPTMFDLINIFEGDSLTLFLKELHKIKLDTLPGTKMSYSNTGIITLGIILENVYKMSYSNLVKKYITEPYAMNNTETVFYKSDTVSYTKGYDKKGNTMPHITFQIAGAAGGLKSTASDMIMYIKENISEKDKAIELSHKETFRNDEQSIGLGWYINNSTKNSIEFWHNGGEPGFSSYILIIPESKVGIICLTNQRGYQYQFSILSKAIIAKLKNE